MSTVDVDDIIVDYPDTFALMKDLQAMGENNAAVTRQMGPVSKDVLLANEGIYRELHGNEDGSLPAFPFLSLLVSGGHTLLVHSPSLTSHTILAQALNIGARQS